MPAFGSLLSHPQRQYDVQFFFKLTFHLDLFGNYNIKTNSNNNLKCIKIIKR